MEKYSVKPIVCDYGVFMDEQLFIICNSHSNALLICEILNKDEKHEIWNVEYSNLILERTVNDGKMGSCS